MLLTRWWFVAPHLHGLLARDLLGGGGPSSSSSPPPPGPPGGTMPVVAMLRKRKKGREVGYRYSETTSIDARADPVLARRRESAHNQNNRHLSLRSDTVLSLLRQQGGSGDRTGSPRREIACGPCRAVAPAAHCFLRSAGAAEEPRPPDPVEETVYKRLMRLTCSLGPGLSLRAFE